MIYAVLKTQCIFNVDLQNQSQPTINNYTLHNHSQKLDFSVQGSYKNSEQLSSGYLSLVHFNTFVKTIAFYFDPTLKIGQ